MMPNSSNNLNSTDTPTLISACLLFQFEGTITYVLTNNPGRASKAYLSVSILWCVYEGFSALLISHT